MTDAKFKRGHPKKGGKKKGTPNKFTNLKQAYLDVFVKIEKESKRYPEKVDSLFMWATKNQRNQGMFYQMISKMLPNSIVGTQDDKGEFHPLKVIISNNEDK